MENITSTEKLAKFLKLEIERGFDNKAVLGGLDKIFPIWENNAAADHLPDDFVKRISQNLQKYGKANLIERKKIIADICVDLNTNNTIIQFPEKLIEEVNTSNPEPEKVSTSQEFETAQKLKEPVAVLKGIAEKYSDKLNKLGVNSLEDLIYYFPRRYDDYSQLKTINRLEYGDELTVIGSVYSINSRPIKGGKTALIEAVITDGTGFLRVTWFLGKNPQFFIRRLEPGTQIVLSGTIDIYLGRLVMKSPDWELLDKEHLNTNRIVPVYSLTAGLTQKNIRDKTYELVNKFVPKIPDYLPPSVRKNKKLVDLSEALKNIHFPDDLKKLEAAQTRLAFDEIFLLQLGVLRQKSQWQQIHSDRLEISNEDLQEQLNQLPYQLTNAQQKVLDDIRKDMASGHPMNRLLQGDVGSGKTIVAAIAATIVTKNEGQVAIMAPTSILAEQHFRTMIKILAEGDSENKKALSNPEIRLLLGGTSSPEKEEIREGLLSGTIKIIVGTHALLEEPIQFKNLKFAVIDEQHRFGVSQRATLRAKGNNPHILVMTATPIPRSLALTIYGDLDLSVMDEMPVGRIPVKTHVIHPLERERAYQLINAEVEKGHQSFIIYPLVEQGDQDERKAAVEEHKKLQEIIFPNFKLGLLHGRLKQEDKDEVMTKFRDGEFNVLVSTSVIEVGVDVPNATVMLVEGANRFGLAQLHQFRGRVGRGNFDSYCLLIPDKESEIENERLSVMTKTNDGFILAERDLDYRGPGEYLGTRQSGYTELKLANLTNVRLIENAREEAINIIREDPELSNPEYDRLAKRLYEFWDYGKGDIS